MNASSSEEEEEEEGLSGESEVGSGSDSDAGRSWNFFDEAGTSKKTRLEREFEKNPMVEQFAKATWEVLEHDEEFTHLPAAPSKADGSWDARNMLPTDATVLELFLLMYPEREIWKPLFHNTKSYARAARRAAASAGEPHTREWDSSSTPFKYERVMVYIALRIAMGIMKLPHVNAYWQGKYRAGAIKFEPFSVWMSQTEFEQIERYFHQVDNTKMPPPDDDNFDKAYKCRPLISALQHFCLTYFKPSSDTSFDEMGIASKHRWLRRFDRSKPHKYFIELLGAACARTGVMIYFWVNEGRTKRVDGEEVPYRAPDFDNDDIYEQRELWGEAWGWIARALEKYPGHENRRYILSADRRC